MAFIANIFNRSFVHIGDTFSVSRIKKKYYHIFQTNVIPLTRFLVESPRWLLSKSREKEAYKVLFGKNPDFEYLDEDENENKVQKLENTEKKFELSKMMKQLFKEFTKLYTTKEIRKRSLISHFSWCMTSMSYYVLGKI